MSNIKNRLRKLESQRPKNNNNLMPIRLSDKQMEEIVLLNKDALFSRYPAKFFQKNGLAPFLTKRAGPSRLCSYQVINPATKSIFILYPITEGRHTIIVGVSQGLWLFLLITGVTNSMNSKQYWRQEEAKCPPGGKIMLSRWKIGEDSGWDQRLMEF